LAGGLNRGKRMKDPPKRRRLVRPLLLAQPSPAVSRSHQAVVVRKEHREDGEDDGVQKVHQPLDVDAPLREVAPLVVHDGLHPWTHARGGVRVQAGYGKGPGSRVRHAGFRSSTGAGPARWRVGLSTPTTPALGSVCAATQRQPGPASPHPLISSEHPAALRGSPCGLPNPAQTPFLAH
jgi:hypothetical protein